MPLGEHLSIGGSYLYHDENSFASLGSSFRTPWFYLGYTYNFNDNIIENATTFLGDNVLIVLWSGFLGVSFSFLLLLFSFRFF